MKILLLIFCLPVLITPKGVLAQAIEWKKDRLEPIGVSMSLKTLDGNNVMQVMKDSTIKADDEPTFVKIKDLSFQDGTITVNVLSRLRANAPSHARGFIGVAFRINDTNSKFECIYIRPANGRADDQVRRNHSIQYFSYPDFKFNKLRKDFPEKYESYADMGLNEWIKLKIVVKGTQARLFLGDNEQPSLIVNDLKLGADEPGAIGLFVDIGTEGYFADLAVSK
jgi:hypothetical protein